MDASPAPSEQAQGPASPAPAGLREALRRNHASIATLAALVFALLWLGAEVTIARLEKEKAALSGREPDSWSERAAAPQPAAEAGRAPQPRRLSDEQREAMLQQLHTASASAAEARAWFVKPAGDVEASAYAESLAEAFRAAGYRVEMALWTQGVLKAGVRMFVGPEEPPPHVQAVMSALEAGGVTVQQFLGYREYRAERIRAGAGAAGVDLRDDQDFVIVVGRAE